MDGVFHCKVLEISSFQKLAYSWKGGSGNGIFSLDTFVEWILEEHGNGTKLILRHSGFNEANLAIFTSMTDGWEKNIHKMIIHLNSKQ